MNVLLINVHATHVDETTEDREPGCPKQGEGRFDGHAKTERR